MKSLINFVHDTQDPELNFQLGLEYEQQGHTGAAISFYLRTAERTRDRVQQYHALLRMALGFQRQRLRDDTQSVILQKAIGLLPRRPEAYFLLARLYEWQQRWHESYFIATVGCNVADFALDALPTDVEYPGEYAVIFQKAVAAWWVGNTHESRELMLGLKINHQMNALFSAAVDNNIQRIGLPYAHTTYDRSQHDLLRVPFDGSADIKRNWSQSFQDLFVLAATQGRRDGTFLEIGSAEPFYGNNTALLETQFGWRGLSVDIDPAKVSQFRAERHSWVECADARTIDWSATLSKLELPTVIDYLQVDCDPPSVSFEILQRLPWDRYQWRVITFEHDHYHDVSVRDHSRAFLMQQGYQLVVSDVAYNRVNSYEDWWVHPELTDPVTIDRLRDLEPGVKYAPDYMLNRR